MPFFFYLYLYNEFFKDTQKKINIYRKNSLYYREKDINNI